MAIPGVPPLGDVVRDHIVSGEMCIRVEKRLQTYGSHLEKKKNSYQDMKENTGANSMQNTAEGRIGRTGM